MMRNKDQAGIVVWRMKGEDQMTVNRNIDNGFQELFCKGKMSKNQSSWQK